MNLLSLNISQINQGLRNKDFSASDISKSYLNQIKENDQKISAFLTVEEESALSEAKKVDKMILENKELPLLSGIPCAIKDNMMVEGVRCTAGSMMLENYLAPYNATVIKKLKKDNAIILGKTNLDEFAMGSSTENSFFGPTRNPIDLERVPGGSSGGSAAAVAGNLSLFALGSDTGGSIRLPASFCGVVGLKPTYGSVSRNGIIAFASSLDQVGPITKTIDDAEIVFNAIKGKDELDSTSVDGLNNNQRFKKKNFDFNNDSAIKELKIGVPKEYFIKGIDPKIEKSIKTAVEKYQRMGARVEEISLPHIKHSLACYYIIACSEASANMARYDGIRYGHSEDKKAKDLLETYLYSREKALGEEVKRRIMIGTYSLSSGYYQAYYLRAQKIRTLIINDFEKAFNKVDLIFGPVAPFLPFKIKEKIEDPLSMYLVDAYTVSVNLAGLPAISFPCDWVDGLPVGLQIIGKPFDEETIFKAAKLYQN